MKCEETQSTLAGDLGIELAQAPCGGVARVGEALLATGDPTLMELVGNLPVLLGGLGLAALGAKVDDTAGPASRTKSPKK